MVKQFSEFRCAQFLYIRIELEKIYGRIFEVLIVLDDNTSDFSAFEKWMLSW